MGGAGSAVNEFLTKANIKVATLNLGLPDKFLDHGKASDMLASVSLDWKGVIQSIQNKLDECKSLDNNLWLFFLLLYLWQAQHLNLRRL